MPARTWKQLAGWAEQLATETVAAEIEILAKPQLLNELGLPRAVRRALQLDVPLTPAAVRVMRFDFHYTTDGWRISEVNSDVPGGFTEASDFTYGMAAHFPGAHPPGDPASVWADAVGRAAGPGGDVGLLAAPGYMEDQQIMAYLARKLTARGCHAHLANVTQIKWQNETAHLETAWYSGKLDAVVRFYQAEWLARLPGRFGWPYFFRGGRTPVGNPGIAAISESKRFGIFLERLSKPMPAWRLLLPESRDPRSVTERRDDSWVLKTAMSNNGDDVCIRELMNEGDWRRSNWSVRLFPSRWVAQRRFQPVPLPTPAGPVYPCIGVYTIDGEVAGAYARFSARPKIDYSAVDVALLIINDE
jgi:glutathionylspermidine synthase